jgi:hypothetical protein
MLINIDLKYCNGCKTTRPITDWPDNKNHKSYIHYGGRGITYCKEWKVFTKFISDMGEKPEGLTLDRTDNDGNYCKENCQWVTRADQNRNQQKSIKSPGKRGLPC